jgi:MFS transporter, DHA3 family, macrolide efflux protein
MPTITSTVEPTDRQPSRLLNKDFVLLWQGQAVSQLGSSIFSIVMIFWIKHATGSASLLGLMMMLSSIPSLVLAGLAGGVADRFSRRNIIILSDVARGLLMLVLAALLHTNIGLAGLLTWVFSISTAMSIAASFFGPAISAALPDIVPKHRLERANSLRSVTRQLCFFLGRIVGATLFRILGAPVLALVNGVSFLLSAVTEGFIRIPQSLSPRARTWRGLTVSLKAELVVGFRHVWRHQGLKRLILAGAFTNFFTMAIIVLLPFYVEDHLAASIDWYGILISVFGIGTALGSGLAGYVALQGKVRANTLIVLIILNSFAAAVLGFMHNVFTAGSIGFGIGAIMGFTDVNFISIVQKGTPSEMRGRIFGFIGTIAGSTVPLGMGFGGLVFDLLDQSIPIVFGGCGAIMALFVALIAGNREFREFLAGPE